MKVYIVNLHGLQACKEKD